MKQKKGIVRDSNGNSVNQRPIFSSFSVDIASLSIFQAFKKHEDS
jgi:hypothetical protein